MIEFIAFMIVGYSEVGPGQCQLDYFAYNNIQSINIQCQENGTLQRGSVGILPYTIYSKQ
jgi:hypothetical protein